MADRFVASVGFVVAGLALAAALLPWTPTLAVGPLGSPVAAGLAGVTMLGFGARRYDVVDDPRSVLVAGVASVGLVLYALSVVLGPALGGGSAPAVGRGLVLAGVAGSLGAVVAYAEWRDVNRTAFLTKVSAGGLALLVGFAGLFVSNVLVLPVLLAEGTLSVGVRTALLTAASGLGLGLVALAFLFGTDRGLAYVDLRWPDRRDVAYMVAGSVVIFALLVGLGYLFEMLNLPSTEHSLVTQARENPEMLLALVPLAWLVIGPGEELLFRNVIQKYLTDSYSRWGAVLLATAIFTGVHVVSYFSQDTLALFLTLVRLFVLSLVLGISYDRTDNVLVPIVIHGTFDGVQFAYLYYLLSSGVA